jgi:hypothetical protein
MPSDGTETFATANSWMGWGFGQVGGVLMATVSPVAVARGALHKILAGDNTYNQWATAQGQSVALPMTAVRGPVVMYGVLQVETMAALRGARDHRGVLGRGLEKAVLDIARQIPPFQCRISVIYLCRCPATHSL